MTADKTTELNYTVRTAHGEDDYWLMRRFLIDTWRPQHPFHNWEIRRLDGSYWHNEQPGFDWRWEGGRAVGLWLADDGRLLGAVHPEYNRGDAWLEVHPDHRGLEPEMLDWAEANLAKPGQDGQRRLKVFVWDYDSERLELLQARGYRQSSEGDVMREKPFSGQEQPARLPAGYTLHCVRPGHPEDCARYAELLNAAFRRTFHNALQLMTFTANSPSFRSELELAAVAPDGSFSALTGMIYDADNRVALFEPVCATPARRPLGLTAALMQEGHYRVRQLGAEHCYVGTGAGMAANRFYNACGFKIFQTGWMWEKEM